MRRVHILIPTIQPNDAVGNDAALMLRVLRDAGYDAHLYAEHIHAACAPFSTKISSEHSALWDDPDALMIYHHAILWELGEDLLARTRNRIAIKYHNVTPPEFFSSYGQHYYWACVKGKESNARLAAIPNIWVWGDSAFNTEEYRELGVPESRCRVVAPLHKIEEFSRQPFDSVVLGSYRRHDTFNMLFVGGMRPNKGHARALEITAALRNLLARPVRLFLVGSFDPYLSSYLEDLQQYVKHLELSTEVEFACSVSPSQLRSFYLNASAFLCVSEHEGFCVPLVEAMAFRVPVVVWNTTATGETTGGCGLVYEHFDAETIAEGLASLSEDPVLGRRLATSGRKRYESVFHPDAISARLLELTKEVLEQ
ncbi:MAG TPA: glycosyltransferase family 4 protein [Bryobacteraceae bacterium]|nr:glycosyltransferase family 4 protein [Bryobacteraceae bacterium]